ncbi:MAG: nucleotidyltransferase domain-containing protein [Candidatus Anstonellales archaeon]
MKKLDEKLANIISRLKKINNVLAIFVFGSYETKKMHPLSDVDVAVVLKKTDPEHVLEIYGYKNETIDVGVFNKFPPQIKFSVIKEGRLVFVRNMKKLQEIIAKSMMEYHDMERLYRVQGAKE